VNKHLLHDLTEMGLWNPSLKNKIISDNGSVQNLSELPGKLKGIYKYGICEFLPDRKVTLIYLFMLTLYNYQNCLGDQAKDTG
jgi:hypothetical protein